MNDLSDLTDGDRIVVEYTPVRGWGSETKTLDIEVVENGLTPDDDAVYLAFYHGENDLHPRRRLVETEDGTVELHSRRSTDEHGTVWATLGEATVERVESEDETPVAA